MNTLLSWALSYADQLGWPVIPLAPGKKTPLTSHGLKDATTDEDTIRSWWKKWPNANIGVVCGGDSGPCVVDVDIDEDNGVDGRNTLVTKYKELPIAVRQETPRGGFHACYCSANPPRTRNNFDAGIDIRSTGAYIVVAPSIHPNGKRYEWAEGMSPFDGAELGEFPEWMRPADKKPKQAQKQMPWGGATPAGGGKSSSDEPVTFKGVPIAWEPNLGGSSEDTIQRARAYLQECDPAVQGAGGHGNLLWAAAAMVHKFDLTDSEALNLLANEFNPRCSPPWDMSSKSECRDFERKITEARRMPPPSSLRSVHDEQAEANAAANSLVKEYMLGKQEQEAKIHCEVAPSTDSVAEGIVDQFRSDRKTKDGWLDVIDPAPKDYGIGYWLKKPAEGSLLSAPSNTEIEEYLAHPTGLVGRICTWINSTSFCYQPMLTLGCVLSFMGTVLGRKVRDPIDSRTNVYCMGIAPSSSGKNHAPKMIRKLAAAAGCVNLLGGTDFASGSAIERRLEKEPSTLFMVDEIGHLLSGLKKAPNFHAGKIVPLLMKLYSSAGSVYIGTEYATEEAKLLVDPCCSVFGTAIPQRFAEGFSEEELYDGWLGRCLVFLARPSDSKNTTPRSFEPPADLAESVAEWVRFQAPQREGIGDIEQHSICGGGMVYTPPPSTIEVPVNDEATKILDSLNHVKCSDERTDFVWTKAEENARKVALIVSCGNSIESPMVTKEVATYAHRLICHLLGTFSEQIVPNIANTHREKIMNRVIEIVKESGEQGASGGDITRRLSKVNRGQRKEIIEDLIESSVVFKDSTRRGVRYWTKENYALSESFKTRQRELANDKTDTRVADSNATASAQQTSAEPHGSNHRRPNG